MKPGQLIAEESDGLPGIERHFYRQGEWNPGLLFRSMLPSHGCQSRRHRVIADVEEGIGC